MSQHAPPSGSAPGSDRRPSTQPDRGAPSAPAPRQGHSAHGFDPVSLRTAVDVPSAEARLAALGQSRSTSALGERADLLRTLGRLDEALAIAEEAFRLAHFTGDRADSTAARIRRAHVFREQGKLERALNDLHTSRITASTEEWRELEAAAAELEGYTLFDLGRHDEARDVLSQALLAYEATGAPRDRIDELRSAIDGVVPRLPARAPDRSSRSPPPRRPRHRPAADPAPPRGRRPHRRRQPRRRRRATPAPATRTPSTLSGPITSVPATASTDPARHRPVDRGHRPRRQPLEPASAPGPRSRSPSPSPRCLPAPTPASGARSPASPRTPPGHRDRDRARLVVDAPAHDDEDRNETTRRGTTGVTGSSTGCRATTSRPPGRSRGGDRRLLPVVHAAHEGEPGHAHGREHGREPGHGTAPRARGPASAAGSTGPLTAGRPRPGAALGRRPDRPAPRPCRVDLRFDNAKTRAGLCDYGKKRITSRGTSRAGTTTTRSTRCCCTRSRTPSPGRARATVRAGRATAAELGYVGGRLHDGAIAVRARALGRRLRRRATSTSATGSRSGRSPAVAARGGTTRPTSSAGRSGRSEARLRGPSCCADRPDEPA